MQPLDPSLAGAFVNLTEPYMQQLDGIGAQLSSIESGLLATIDADVAGVVALGQTLTGMLEAMQADLLADTLIDPVAGVGPAGVLMAQLGSLAGQADVAAVAGAPNVPFRISTPPTFPTIPQEPPPVPTVVENITVIEETIIYGGGFPTSGPCDPAFDPACGGSGF